MSKLTSIEGLSVSEVEQWLERALRGREPLPLIVPDEYPFLAIARLEDTLDPITRKDLRTATVRLMTALARGEEMEDEYVVALTGLVVELDVRRATSVLSGIAKAKGFGERPVRQQAAVLSALIDLRHSMPEEFWHEVLHSGRNVPLALRALLERGTVVLQHLSELSVDQDVADTLYIVLDQHAKRLDSNLRDELVKKAQSVVGTSSGEIRAMLEDWLHEQGVSVDDDPERIDREFQKFFAAFSQRHEYPQLQRSPSDARLVAA